MMSFQDKRPAGVAALVGVFDLRGESASHTCVFCVFAPSPCVSRLFRQNELDRVHKVRMGVGNGLRPDVWREFHSRFGNIRMCEVYGSTEGNLCFMNHIGKIGTVGRSNSLYKVRGRDGG